MSQTSLPLLAPLRGPMLEALLVRLPCSAFMVGRDAALLLASPAGEALLVRDQALVSRGGRLRCRAAADSARLDAALSMPSEDHLLVCGDQAERIGLRLSPLAGGEAWLILASGPRPRLSSVGLSTLFDLTPSEARLVVALVAGLSLEEYSRESRLALGTVRWTLKNVFTKTDTSRQAELVALVLSSIAPFDRS